MALWADKDVLKASTLQLFLEDFDEWGIFAAAKNILDLPLTEVS